FIKHHRPPGAHSLLPIKNIEGVVVEEVRLKVRSFDEFSESTDGEPAKLGSRLPDTPGQVDIRESIRAPIWKLPIVAIVEAAQDLATVTTHKHVTLVSHPRHICCQRRLAAGKTGCDFRGVHQAAIFCLRRFPPNIHELVAGTEMPDH